MVKLWYYNGILNGGRRDLEWNCYGIIFVFLYDNIEKKPKELSSGYFVHFVSRKHLGMNLYQEIISFLFYVFFR